VQKVDVLQDGKLWLSGQKSNSDALWTRVRSRAQTAAKLEIRRHVDLPAPPPHVFLPSQRVIFFANYTDEAVAGALASNSSWTFAITADPAYNDDENERTLRDRLIDGLRHQGRPPRPWCDCEGTPFAVAKRMAVDLSLPAPIGQCEKGIQYWDAIHGGAKIVIGEFAQLKASDPTALADAIAKSQSGEVQFIGEVLHPDATYSAQGVSITSACFYLGLDDSQYQPRSAFDVMPPGLQVAAGGYHAAAYKAADWALTR
jgi:hypothetical protein